MNVVTYGGIAPVNTGNVPNSLVERGSDGSITCGPANVSLVNNTGGMISGIKAVTGVTTLDTTASLITTDATGGAFALNLPPVSSVTGVEFTIVNKTAHTTTITSNGSDNILTSAGSSVTTYPMSNAGQQVFMWSDGVQWYLKV